MSAVWKNNAPYAICLTHDVDRITKQWYHYGYYATKAPGIQLSSFWQKLSGKEPYWNFYHLMELEMEIGVRSTFLFLNEPVRKLSANFMGRYRIQEHRVKQMILELDRNGFEIGLHGSFYSYNQKEQLKTEKQVLEDILGHDVVSTRQHHLNFDPDVTWEIHSELGLRFDSSLGFSNQVGLQQPFVTSEGILEMPITLMDTVSMRQEEERKQVLLTCDKVAAQGGLIMLNFHQCHYNPLEYPQNTMVYTELLKAANSQGAWIAPMREIGTWIFDGEK